MRKIAVDDEVYAFLQEHARPFVDTENDVLRCLLLGQAPRTDNRRAGDLKPLIDAGLLEAGDVLTHVQPRRGIEHHASVTEDGYLRTADGQEFARPSPALKAQVGHETNGWTQWTHQRTGQRLQELRAQRRNH
jgi:hypothetical protein